ncbi:MAG TPA: hypothetical protein VFJ98_04085 [Mycobacteriales bacterium]|nr:hypothetical protein [Mycobacteriales bacterium]
MGAIGGRRRRTPTTSEHPLEGLLEEMRDLRLTLAADLTAAAGAAEAGADEVAAEIVDADRAELERFARVADLRLGRLQRLAVARPEAPRWRRRLTVALPVVPVVGAIAVSAAAATGVLPLPERTAPAPRPAIAAQQAGETPVGSTFREFADLVGADPSAAQVIAAADRLHRQLARMLASPTTDADRAAQIAELLRMEQTLLLREQPPGADVVLHETRKLAARLVDVVSALTRPADVPDVLPTFGTDENRTKKGATSPAPDPSPTKSTKTNTSSSPAPDPSPSPSATYNPPVLPGISP